MSPSSDSDALGSRLEALVALTVSTDHIVRCRLVSRNLLTMAAMVHVHTRVLTSEWPKSPARPMADIVSWQQRWVASHVFGASFVGLPALNRLALLRAVTSMFSVEALAAPSDAASHTSTTLLFGPVLDEVCVLLCCKGGERSPSACTPLCVSWCKWRRRPGTAATSFSAQSPTSRHVPSHALPPPPFLPFPTLVFPAGHGGCKGSRCGHALVRISKSGTDSGRRRVRASSAGRGRRHSMHLLARCLLDVLSEHA